VPVTCLLPRRRFLVALAAGLLSLTCADRERRNPLDPGALNPIDGVQSLRAVAGDGQVRLEWDYTWFDDVEGLRLYRTAAGVETVRDLPSSVRELVDGSVANGVTYQYRLGLGLAGGRERLLDPVVSATPGPGVVWVADRGSGQVYQVSPDGRSAGFSRGRFPILAAVAVDPVDGSCWVSDERIAGLHRIGRDGDMVLVAASLARPGDLSIAARGDLGWVVDRDRQRVYSFSPRADTDTLSLVEADASFVEPVSLAAAGEACWIADRATGRVILYRRDGTRLGEWQGLESPQLVASVSASPALAWVLADQGRQVSRLGPEGSSSALDLPFAPVLDLYVDSSTGLCWLLGDDAVAAVNSEGGIAAGWTAPPGGQRLAADAADGALWIAERDQVWKIDAAGVPLARLIGFSRLISVAVDPGRR